MLIFWAFVLSFASSTFTHSAVRGAAGGRRRAFISLACLSFAGAVALAELSQGFWAALYSMFAIYILASTISPWIVYLWEQRHAR